MRRRPMTFPAELMMGLLRAATAPMAAPAPRRQPAEERDRHLAAAQAKRERRLAKRRAELQRAQGRGR